MRRNTISFIETDFKKKLKFIMFKIKKYIKSVLITVKNTKTKKKKLQNFGSYKREVLISGILIS